MPIVLLLAISALASPPIVCKMVAGKPVVVQIDSIVVNGKAAAIRTLVSRDQIICEQDTTKEKK